MKQNRSTLWSRLLGQYVNTEHSRENGQREPREHEAVHVRQEPTSIQQIGEMQISDITLQHHHTAGHRK